MLVQKKISAKKSAIYIFIIFFMMSGAGFMLYQNKKLAARPLTNVNQPVSFNNAAPEAAMSEASQASAINNKQSGGLNLDIFSSDKFKNLRANVFIVKEPPEVGKRNPFKPN